MAPTFSSCSRPAEIPQTGITANDSLMELLFMIDAAVGASCAPGDRRHALVRIFPPGQEVRAT